MKSKIPGDLSLTSVNRRQELRTGQSDGTSPRSSEPVPSNPHPVPELLKFGRPPQATGLNESGELSFPPRTAFTDRLAKVAAKFETLPFVDSLADEMASEITSGKNIAEQQTLFLA